MSEIRIQMETDAIEGKSATSMELEPRFGTSIVIHIRPTDEYLFFLRDEKPDIPHPGRICPIGGRRNPGEEAEEAIRREFAEEVVYLGTDRSFPLPEIHHLETIERDDGYPGAIDIFSCIFEEDPEISINEGQGLVRLSRDETLAMVFPYGFTQIVHQYVESQTIRSPEQLAPLLHSGAFLRLAVVNDISS